MAWRIAVVLLLALPWAPPAAAQAVLRLQVDNDAMVIGPRHDRDYTHGVDASFGHRRCTLVECHVFRLGLVQALFTPDLRDPIAPPADRAFAGYIGLRGALERWARHSTWQVAATAGVRGPAALGEPLQRFIHGVFGFVDPPPWDPQLGTAPWLAVEGSAGRWLLMGPARAGVLAHAELGTMRTFAAAGLRLSLGADARWLDPRPIDGVRPGVGFEAGEQWYAADATLHGIDGGAGVAGVQHWRRWVGADATLRAHAWAFTLAMKWFGKDFDGQSTAPVVGSAALQWSPP